MRCPRLCGRSVACASFRVRRGGARHFLRHARDRRAAPPRPPTPPHYTALRTTHHTPPRDATSVDPSNDLELGTRHGPLLLLSISSRLSASACGTIAPHLRRARRQAAQATAYHHGSQVRQTSWHHHHRCCPRRVADVLRAPLAWPRAWLGAPAPQAGRAGRRAAHSRPRSRQRSPGRPMRRCSRCFLVVPRLVAVAGGAVLAQSAAHSYE